MEIKIIKVEDVKTADYNPREISKNELEKLKSSLTEFGCVRPIIINKKTGLLVSGHQTLQAAKELGLETLPSLEIDIDETKEKVLNIGLNKISGDWDYDKLNVLLEEIKDVDVFDCSGFDVSDIDLMEKLSDDGSLVSDSAPEEAKVPVHSLTFDFDDEADMVAVKRYFSNCKSGWKDKNKPNSKQLKDMVNNNE